MSTFRYIIRDTFRLLSRHWGLSFLTLVTAVAVFYLVGASALFVLNSKYLVATVEGSLTIQAYVEDTPEAMEAVTRRAAAFDCVSSVEPITSGQALERLRARLGNQADAVTLLGQNPLPSSVEIQVRKAAFASVVAREMIAMPEVEDVVYAGELAERLESISAFVSRLSLVVLLISITSAALVLFNTIRISVYARKEEIDTMLLVGTTQFFVSFPFVLQGVILGAAGALLSSLLLGFSYGFAVEALHRSLPFLRLISDPKLVMRLSGVLVLGGVSVGWVCSWLAVSKFVRSASRPH